MRQPHQLLVPADVQVGRCARAAVCRIPGHVVDTPPDQEGGAQPASRRILPGGIALRHEAEEGFQQARRVRVGHVGTVSGGIPGTGHIQAGRGALSRRLQQEAQVHPDAGGGVRRDRPVQCPYGVAVVVEGHAVPQERDCMLRPAFPDDVTHGHIHDGGGGTQPHCVRGMRRGQPLYRNGGIRAGSAVCQHCRIGNGNGGSQHGVLPGCLVVGRQHEGGEQPGAHPVIQAQREAQGGGGWGVRHRSKPAQVGVAAAAGGQFKQVYRAAVGFQKRIGQGGCHRQGGVGAVSRLRAAPDRDRCDGISDDRLVIAPAAAASGEQGKTAKQAQAKAQDAEEFPVRGVHGVLLSWGKNQIRAFPACMRGTRAVMRQSSS